MANATAVALPALSRLRPRLPPGGTRGRYRAGLHPRTRGGSPDATGRGADFTPARAFV